VTAPSPVSYLRLTPNRWAPTAIDIQLQDRGAALRVCPLFAAAGPAEAARQFNLEFRAADAAASPYLALGAVLFAGADGIGRELPLRPPGTPPLLPRRLSEALDHLAASGAARRWFGPVFLDAYLCYKRAEAERAAGLDPATLCARYAEVY
jgi:glutamine synthetase